MTKEMTNIFSSCFAVQLNQTNSDEVDGVEVKLILCKYVTFKKPFLRARNVVSGLVRADTWKDAPNKFSIFIGWVQGYMYQGSYADISMFKGLQIFKIKFNSTI